MASLLADPDAEILMPGETEERYREQRRREGCPLAEDTWQSIVECAKREGLSEQLIPQTTKEPYRSHH